MAVTNSSLYGSDLRGLLDIDLRLSLDVGLGCLAHDLISRLTDELWYNPDSGYPILNMLNGIPELVPTVESAVEAELSKDDRVSGVSCNITTEGDKWTIQILVQPTDPSSEFKLIGQLSALDKDDLHWTQVT